MVTRVRMKQKRNVRRENAKLQLSEDIKIRLCPHWLYGFQA
jgi:hypothetical protein